MTPYTSELEGENVTTVPLASISTILQTKPSGPTSKKWNATFGPKFHSLDFGIRKYIYSTERRAEVSGAGCRMTESDGEATRGSSDLLGGAFLVFFFFLAPPSRRWRSSSPLSGA